MYFTRNREIHETFWRIKLGLAFISNSFGFALGNLNVALSKKRNEFNCLCKKI